MTKDLKWKRPGYLVFLATIVVATAELIHVQMIAVHGYPNSDQGEAAYYYNIRGVVLTIVCCIIILYILLSEHSGYYRAIFIWCMLITGLCLCLVGVVRSIVWLSFSDSHKLNEMGNHTRNRFEGGLGLSQHERSAVKLHNCCGIKGILTWRHITDSRKSLPDEHDIDELNEFEFLNPNQNKSGKEERRGAHVPDECCSRFAYFGCGESNFLKVIDYLEEPISIMSEIDPAEWADFENNNYRPTNSGYYAVNISDARILIPNDDISLWNFPGVHDMCKDTSLQRMPLYVYHVGRIYVSATGIGGSQGSPCLIEDQSPDCQPGSIKFVFSTVFDFCLFVQHTVLKEEDIAKVVDADGLLYTKVMGCGEYMIPYINEITMWTLIYSTLVLILLSCVMVVFHKMYIELRLVQLKDELPPRWYKPFEAEEGEILGFGDVPHIPSSERIKGPDEPFKEYAKAPKGKYKGPKFTDEEIRFARTLDEEEPEVERKNDPRQSRKSLHDFSTL